MTRWRSLCAVATAAALIAACGGGGGGSTGPGNTYTVVYDANGATSGTVPVDSSRYQQGQTVTVRGNTGGLAQASHTFSGWNTAANGTGTSYVAGQTFTIGAASVTLYAQWTTGGSLTVTYDANGATGGTVPVDAGHYSSGQSVTVLGNPGSLVCAGYTFLGWQTMADGSGKVFAPGSSFSMGAASVTLHALWVGGTAYAVDDSGAVSQYWIASNGALVPMFTPYVASGGGDPRYLSADPSGKYLYVSNITSNDIGMFTIDPAGGGLAPMSPPTVPSSTGSPLLYPFGSAVHPTGAWFYVVNDQQGTVSQFTIGATGGLGARVTTTLMTPETSQAVAPYKIAIVPSGRYAFVACQIGNSTAHGAIYELAIDQATGVLADNGVVRTVDPAFGYTTPASLVTTSTASGDYVYAGNYQSGTIWAYKVGSDGKLTLQGTASVAGASMAIHGLAAHPAGKYLYAAVYNGNQAVAVAQFTIDAATGVLSAMTPATLGAGGYAAASVAVDPSGKYAYVTSGESGWGSTSIAQYTIDQATGALTPMSNPTVLSQVGPAEIVTVGR